MSMSATPTTSVVEMIGVITDRTPIKRPEAISFFDSDLPPEGKNHNKTLFIKVQIMDREIPYVMIDNGSALNLCPLNVLPLLGMNKDMLEQTSMMIIPPEMLSDRSNQR